MEQPVAEPREAPGHMRRKNVVFGAILMVAGVILFIQQATVFHVFELWPLVVLGIGVVQIAGACCWRRVRSGVWLTALGSWFALNEFTRLGYHDTWPLLLLVIGALMVWDAVAPGEHSPTCPEGRHGH